MPEAKESALRALALEETVFDAHTALAVVLHYYEWDWAGAVRAYRRALELDPGDTFARSHYAVLLGQLGRADESVTEGRAAVEGDPVAPFSRLMLAFTLIMARRFDSAITEAQAAIELESGYHPFHWVLGWALAGVARHDDAVAACRQATIVAPGDPGPQALLGTVLGLAGQRQEALTILADLEQRRTQEYVGGVLLAYVNLGLGDHVQAISWLQQAAEERDGLMTYLNTWFLFDPLRDDPRLQDLLKKMNFPQQ